MLRTASEKTSERINRKALFCFLTSIMLLMILPVFAGDKEKDEDTLRQASLVLQGFLNSNNISLTSLSKANCAGVDHLPSKFPRPSRRSESRRQMHWPLWRRGPPLPSHPCPSWSFRSESDLQLSES